MKKLLIATLLSAFALSAHSQVYVQADLGSSRVALEDEAGGEEVLSGTVFTQRLSVGYDFQNNFRVAVDYTNFGKIKNTYSDGYYSADVSLKVKSLGVTGFYDFKSSSNFTPYVGVRLAHNKADVNVQAYNSYNSVSGSDSVSRIGLGVLGGVQYKLTNNMALNANIEYNRLASDAYSAGANIGLRYNF